jgi:UDP-N-acetyl-D-glucosamine dehydrogenase
MLENLIKNRKAKVAVIGLGYVGLPTAVELVRAGFSVFGIDIDKKRIAQINKGESYIIDISSEELKKTIRSKKLKASDDFKVLKYSDVVLICVPTPLTKNKVPDLSYIQESVRMVAENIHRGQLIILESSTYPGTTREIVLPSLQKSGLKVGKDFFVAFGPERVDPGNKNYKLKDVPRVVGGITKRCTQLAAEFYKSFIAADIFPLSSPEAAEMTKIIENTFRLVNISMINEAAILCDKMNIDIWEVIEAAKTKPYGFFPFYPSPKVGGHCAPLDPFYLSYKAKEYNFWSRFIELAGEVNDNRPYFVVEKAVSVLNKNKKSINGAKVLIWGVAYKKDVADSRESAAYDVIPGLLDRGAKVDYFDPFIGEFKFNGKILKSIRYSLPVLRKYDLVLILTDHTGFNYKEIAKKAKLIIDTRNAVKSKKYKNVFLI